MAEKTGKTGNSDSVGFGTFVAGYQRVVDPLTLPIGLQALELAGVSSGDRLIDVAAGTGALALAAAQRGARVLATDISPEMVARAAERLAPFDGCEARVMSFDKLDMADESFDSAVSILGVLAFAEGRKGLRELVRVTRPGGCVVVATWDQQQSAAPQYLASEVFAEVFPGRQLWPDDFFPRWSREAIAAALREAGCERAQMHVCKGEWTVNSPAEVMDESGPSISRFPGYQTLNDAERERFAKAFTAAVSRFARPDGVARITTKACVGIGHLARPAG